MTNPQPAPPGTPCWADLWTSDPDAVRGFYSRLFGWTALEPSPEFGGYWMFDRDGSPTAGGMGPMGDTPPSNTWKPYFSTPDIDATLKAAEAAGATSLGGAMPVADLGVQAVLSDPTGAQFGLWQPGTFSGFEVVGEVGSPSWFELHTRDHAAAVSFYRDLFGYGITAVSDTDEFRYFTFRSPGSEEDRGGIMDSARWLSGGGDHWDIYWQVDDAGAAAEKVKSLGGSVEQGPDQTPYGVLVLASDPAGAQFKLRS